MRNVFLPYAYVLTAQVGLALSVAHPDHHGMDNSKGAFPRHTYVGYVTNPVNTRLSIRRSGAWQQTFNDYMAALQSALSCFRPRCKYKPYKP